MFVVGFLVLQLNDKENKKLEFCLKRGNLNCITMLICSNKTLFNH